jgi:hypothetical protein
MSDKLPAGCLCFGFGFFFVFVVDVVDQFCEPAVAAATAAAVCTCHDNFLCQGTVGEHRLLLDVLAMIGSGPEQWK